MQSFNNQPPKEFNNTNSPINSPQQFLTPEESADIEAALLDSSEKFLTRLTISSWRLLTLIAQDLDVSVEELTPPQIIAWFEQDSKIRREQGLDAAKLKW